MDWLLDELKDLGIGCLLGNISAKLQDTQMTLHFYVLLVLGCEKCLRSVKKMSNYMMCYRFKKQNIRVQQEGC